MSTSVGGIGNSVEIVPSISVTAYSADDQLGGVQAITGAALSKDKTTTLISLTVHDQSKQKKSMTLFFFDNFPTVSSADNTPIQMTPSEMADKCIGSVAFTSADYADISASSLLTLGIGRTGIAMKSKAQQGTIYVVPKINESGTYAVGALLFRYLFNQDA